MNIKGYRVYKAVRTVAELPDGRWTIRELGRYYKSATGAWKALKREARDYARHQRQIKVVGCKTKYAMLQLVTWMPSSKAGMAAIRAITE